jgi:peptide/nickel transport system permease protein
MTAMKTVPATPTPASVEPAPSVWRDLRHQYRESRMAMLGLVLLATILALAVFAPWISPQNPYDLSRLDILEGRLPPGSRGADGTPFLIGSDEQGRDILSAVFYGLRISVGVGILSTLIALFVGAMLGLVAGYRGGTVDAIIMRTADLQLSFPPILLALIMLALLGPGITNIMLALVAVQWAYYARTTRSAALVESRKEYMEAARGLGLGASRIMFRHLLPNCLPPLIVIAGLQIASAITLEATLSFLGLGVPITQPSLGLLIANGFQYLMSGKYWISLFPGIALFLTIVSINLVADRLRDVLNPRLQSR